MTDLAVCGFCERPLRSELASAGLVAYRCEDDAPRVHLLRSAPPVDAWVRLLAIDRLDRPDVPDLLADPDSPDLYALRAASGRLGPPRAASGGLRARRTQLEDGASQGTVDRSHAAAGVAHLDAELAIVEDQMIDHIQRDLPASLTGADPLEIAWDRLGVPRQRLVLRMLVGRIVLHPVPPGPPPRRSGRPAQDGDRPVADRVIRAA